MPSKDRPVLWKACPSAPRQPQRIHPGGHVKEIINVSDRRKFRLDNIDLWSKRERISRAAPRILQRRWLPDAKSLSSFHNGKDKYHADYQQNNDGCDLRSLHTDTRPIAADRSGVASEECGSRPGKKTHHGDHINDTPPVIYRTAALRLAGMPPTESGAFCFYKHHICVGTCRQYVEPPGDWAPVEQRIRRRPVLPLCQRHILHRKRRCRIVVAPLDERPVQDIRRHRGSKDHGSPAECTVPRLLRIAQPDGSISGESQPDGNQDDRKSQYDIKEPQFIHKYIFQKSHDTLRPLRKAHQQCGQRRDHNQWYDGDPQSILRFLSSITFLILLSQLFCPFQAIRPISSKIFPFSFLQHCPGAPQDILANFKNQDFSSSPGLAFLLK